MRVAALFLVLFGVVAVCEAASTGTRSTQGTSCESQLTVCERNVQELRRQRERVTASRKKLEFQVMRMGLQKRDLDNEIMVLNFQINHPGMEVPGCLGGTSGTREKPGAPEVILPNSAPCRSRLSTCVRSGERAREVTQEQEQICTTLRNTIAEKTQEHAVLRATANSLRQQLLRSGVTPHPSAGYLPYSGNLQSSAEFDADSSEIDRRVAASLAVASYVGPNTRR